jgi:hypothetical protein
MSSLLEALTIRDHNTEFRLFDSSGKPKLLWQENRLGKLLRLAGVDCRVPFLTGSRQYIARSHNLITNVGHVAANARISGQGSYGTFVNLAIGTGTAAAAATDTALGTEITTNGGGRGAATATQVTTTVTNDTTQLVKTWTFTGAFAVTEEGIFDNATSGGNMLARQVFAAVNVASGDSLTVTHKVQS